MNWLITGGCGFIGTNLVARLLQQFPTAHIRILDSLLVGAREDLSDVCDFIDRSIVGLDSHCNPHPRVELLVGDIRDYGTCVACCEGRDIVVHLAASTGVGPSVDNPREDLEVNVLGTFNMLEAAKNAGVRKFVFASSGAPLGEVEPPIHEEVTPHPVSPYGASKLAGEAYCSVYHETFAVETVCLRFGNVYGPRSKNKGSVVAKFIRNILTGNHLEIYGDGEQTRDFIYVEDIVEAILRAAERSDVGGEIFQIATNSETTVNELASRIVELMPPSWKETVQIIKTAIRKGDVRRNFSDTSKAKEYMGWEARVDINRGLRKTIDWFVEKEEQNYQQSR